MGVPNHRPDCQTVPWNTRCWDCQDMVFFFGCSCGSKVLFDSPGPPWPLHRDRCIPYLFSYLRDVEGLGITRVGVLVTERAKEMGVPIPAEIQKELLKREFAEKGRYRVVEVELEGDQAPVVGEIKVLNHKINIFKRLKLPKNFMSEGILGELSRTEWAEIAVREAADPETGIAVQLSGVMDQRECNELSLRIGARIKAVVKKKRLAGGLTVSVFTNAVVQMKHA